MAALRRVREALGLQELVPCCAAALDAPVAVAFAVVAVVLRARARGGGKYFRDKDGECKARVEATPSAISWQMIMRLTRLGRQSPRRPSPGPRRRSRRHAEGDAASSGKVMPARPKHSDQIRTKHQGVAASRLQPLDFPAPRTGTRYPLLTEWSLGWRRGVGGSGEISTDDA